MTPKKLGLLLPHLFKNFLGHVQSIGESIFFLRDIFSLILRGRVRGED